MAYNISIEDYMQEVLREEAEEIVEKDLCWIIFSLIP